MSVCIFGSDTYGMLEAWKSLLAELLTADIIHNFSGAPIRDAAGQIVGGVVVSRDVTGQYRLKQQQRVWERFYQVAAPGRHGPGRGLGLGLAIAKALVEQHQGQVGVQSAPGRGSTFWFSLPLAGGSNQA